MTHLHYPVHWAMYVRFVPLEETFKLLDLLLLYSELLTEKTIFEPLDYELLAEQRTVLGTDRRIYRFRRSANSQ